MRLIFEQWTYSILNESAVQYFQSEEKSYIDKALSLNRNGLRFFRMKNQFYFDCYYLTEAFDKSLLNDLYVFLLNTGSNIFTKAALNKTNNYFIKGRDGIRVEDTLLRHRNHNLCFENKYENRILVTATVSAGKSTLINALIGHFFNRAMTEACTSRICNIHNKYTSDGMTLKHGDLYSYDSLTHTHTSEDANEIGIHYNSTLGSHRLCLIDTPGVNNAIDTKHFEITSNEIKSQNYDCVIFISNCQYNGTNDERRLLQLLHTETKKPIIFVLNQLDRFNRKKDDVSKMIKDYEQELVSIGFDAPRIFPLSAQYAYLLRNKDRLDEDEYDDLELMKKRFTNSFFDLQSYVGDRATSELEKSGIVQLEKEIIQHLK